MSRRRSTRKISKMPGENGRNGRTVEELTKQNVDKVSQLEEADLSHEPHLAALTEDTMPERLVEQIKASEEIRVKG